MNHTAPQICFINFIFMKTKRLIIWKDVPGFEEKYKISNKGEVKSLARKVKHSLYKTQTLQTKLLKPITKK